MSFDSQIKKTHFDLLFQILFFSLFALHSNERANAHQAHKMRFYSISKGNERDTSYLLFYLQLLSVRGQGY